jgi:hypothetical protein
VTFGAGDVPAALLQLLTASGAAGFGPVLVLGEAAGDRAAAGAGWLVSRGDAAGLGPT